MAGGEGAFSDGRFAAFVEWRRDVAPDVHAPLREDVRRLGDLLGRTLREQSGQELYRLVEAVRAESKAGRAGDPDAAERLRARLAALPVAQAVPLARAFAQFLMLANIAEQHHRVRRRRDHAREETSGPQRGSLQDVLPRLVGAGVEPRAILETARTLRIEAVFTAHPTEITRRTMLAKQQRIATILAELDHEDLTPNEREDAEAALEREIIAMWRTRDLRSGRPTPEDEARGSFAVIEKVLWDAVPLFLRRLDSTLRESTGAGVPFGTAPIRFASWIGGDRDGNPRVTHEVTERVVFLARWMAADLALREVEALRDELSIGGASRELRDRVGDHPEPYRELLREPRDRLRGTLLHLEARLRGEPPPDAPRMDSTEGLLAPLRLAHASLCATGAERLAEGRLTDLLRRLDCFSLALVRLDVRQDAARHHEPVGLIARELGETRYAAFDDAERERYLRGLLAFDAPRLHDALRDALALGPDEQAKEVFDTLRVLSRLPRDSLGNYVVSMTHGAADILEVLVLQHAAGVEPPLPVVPLFETRPDLENAARILDALLQIPAYRAASDGAVEVMIGYSDSAKEVGMFAAAWALYRAQETLIATGDRRRVPVRIFHGRGGTVGRGGGPAHAAVLSLPRGAVENGLRVTEQGEMIQARYGLPGIALRTLELYVTAALEARLLPPAPPRSSWRSVMDRMAEAAQAAYEEVVEQPDFVPFFQAMTPVEELEGLNIGSRPARRATGKPEGLSSLRAIPWVFAWTQNRLILPGWLGVGEALRAARIEHGGILREMHAQWPFLRSTVDMAEMVLAKTAPRIAGEYLDRLVPEPLRHLGDDLLARHARTVQEVLLATGHRELLEENPVLQRSIQVRNPYVDPLNLLQVELLRREREGTDERVEEALLVTVGGVAQGMRNTG